MRPLLLATLLLLAACGDRDPVSRETLRVALVTPGSINDAAWNAGAYAGLQRIRDSLFADISHVEARTPGEQEEALRTYAAQGYDLVFGHGFEFQQPAERVSREFPATVFAVTSGHRVEANVVPLIFRFHEATYLVGMVAGALTRSNRIGFVGGMELPPVVLGYQGWLQGARAVNPDIDSRIAWLNTFDDPAAGKEAATAMIRLGVDELHHNADAAGLGVFSAALENAGVHVYGANADQASLAPERVPASAVIDLPRAMLMVVRDATSKDFKPRVESFGLESGVIRFAANPAFPEILAPELLARIAAAEDSIIAGTLVVAGTGVQ